MGEKALLSPPPIVLQIDDDPVFRFLTQAAAARQHLPWAFVIGASVDEGRKLIQLFARDEDIRRRPSLALFDFGLGDGSGFDLLRLIKDEPALEHVPVLLWSAVDLSAPAAGQHPILWRCRVASQAGEPGRVGGGFPRHGNATGPISTGAAALSECCCALRDARP